MSATNTAESQAENGDSPKALQGNWWKILLGDHLRRMCDNQRTLNLTNAHDRRNRALDAKIDEALAQKQFGIERSEEEAETHRDDMKIMIDSPTTTTHHHYPQPQTAPPTKSNMGTLGKLALSGALLASGAGIGSAIPLAISALSEQAPPAAETPADQDTLFDLELVP